MEGIPAAVAKIRRDFVESDAVRLIVRINNAFSPEFSEPRARDRVSVTSSFRDATFWLTLLSYRFRTNANG